METIAGIAIIPLIVGIVAAIKKAGLNSKYAPLVAMLLGVVVVSLELGLTSDAIVTGIVIGLSASGLWSGGKTLIKK